MTDIDYIAGMIKESEAIDDNGKTIDLYFIDHPMCHEDWHEVEKNGLVLISAPQEGESWIFSKLEDEERAKIWLES